MIEKYKVELDDYQGPLDLLLQLIERQEMDITKVSLAKVAEQFIAYMNLKPIIMEETADFLVVAAKLIYIKSKALLPTLDIESEDEIDLEKQLKMYKEYLAASKKIQQIISAKQCCFSKEKFPDDSVNMIFYVPKSLTKERLRNIYVQVIDRIKPVMELPKKVIEKAIKLSERIQHIRETVMKQACSSFNKIICDPNSKTERIISFLAVLELVKQKIIDVEQDHLFEDITLKNLNEEK